MNVIIPMAGEGSRFKKVGFDVPKHMIEVRGKSLFEWSLLSLKNFFDEKFIFLTRKEHNTSNFIREKCRELGINSIRIKEIDYLTKGQAATVLLSDDLISDKESRVLIYNIDTYIASAIKKESIKGDGWVPAFKAGGDKWSFIKFDKDKKVTEATEKVRISDYATIGLYYFKSLNLFRELYENHDYGDKEHYIAPLYNDLLNMEGKSVYTEILDSAVVHVLGTPEDVLEFSPKFQKVLNSLISF